MSKYSRDNGWNFELTPKSGDQGAGIIANRGPLKMENKLATGNGMMRMVI